MIYYARYVAFVNRFFSASAYTLAAVATNAINGVYIYLWF